jgi:hypothetical protein
MKTFWRVGVLAHHTLREALRQKVLNILLLFALVTIGSANLFTVLTPDEQLKFIKDFGFGAMTVFGTLLAVMGIAQMVQGDVEGKLLYVILAKPVRRAEWLWGRFLGLVLLLGLALSVMGAVLALVLWLKEWNLIAAVMKSVTAETRPEALAEVAKIQAAVWQVGLLQVFLLVGAKVLLVAGVALLISTVATSTLFTVAMTLLIYVIGHLQSVAREVWFNAEVAPLWGQKVFAASLAIIIPDFSAYGILDDVLAGHAVAWSHVGQLLAYATLYVGVLMVVAQLVFEEREL